MRFGHKQTRLLTTIFLTAFPLYAVRQYFIIFRNRCRICISGWWYCCCWPDIGQRLLNSQITNAYFVQFSRICIILLCPVSRSSREKKKKTGSAIKCEAQPMPEWFRGRAYKWCRHTVAFQLNAGWRKLNGNVNGVETAMASINGHHGQN